MTGTVAYILAKKIALSAVSGIQNITLSPTGQLIFQFKDGSSVTWQIPLPKDGKDGLSIVKVKIDENKHLICTMSDNSTIDAGELPSDTNGGLIQAGKLSDFPNPGVNNFLYLALDEESLYYWDNKSKQYNPVNGKISEEVTIFPQAIYIEEKDIPSPWPESITLVSTSLKDISNLTIDQKSIIKSILVVNNKNKIVGCGMVTKYDQVVDTFDIVLTKYGEGSSINGSLAEKEDIDKLFENEPTIDIDSSTLATKEDIDKLFNNSDDIIIPESDIYATEPDIDKLFNNGDITIPESEIYATKPDIDKLFNLNGDITETLGLASKEDINKLFGKSL